MFFVMRVYRSRFSMISAFESRCLGVQNQAFGVRCVAKIIFSHMLGYMFLNGFGANFDDFWCLGDKLEI